MKVSMKVNYGVRALVDLAQHERGRLIQTSEIARRQQVPEPFLDHVLTNLRKAGLIRSRRGPQGGHILAKTAGEICLAEVVDSLEGSQPPIDCKEKGEESCSHSGSCAQQAVWRTIEEATREILRSTSIGDLAERQSRQEGRPAT